MDSQLINKLMDRQLAAILLVYFLFRDFLKQTLLVLIVTGSQIWEFYAFHCLYSTFGVVGQRIQKTRHRMVILTYLINQLYNKR